MTHHLRVAVWVKVFPPRYESFIVNQIEGLLARGHEVHVVANRKGDHWHLVSQQMQEQLKGRIHYQPSVPPRRMQRWVGAAAMSVASAVTRPSSVGALLGVVTRSARLGNTDLLFKMLPFLKQQPFDVVHCQYAPLGVTAVALKSWGALRGRIVTSCRGHDLSQLETGARSSYQQLFKQGDFFLPVCDHFRQRLVNLGCPTAKLAVHRSGIDCTRLREVSRRTSKTDLAPQLITVGRLVEKKGVEYGIRAVARLTKRIPHLHYTVIGDGPMRERLERLATQLGVGDNVSLVGWLEHASVIDRLCEAHVYIQPSVTAEDGTEEGIPNALKEAMALGVPVVATRHTGIPELIEDGVSGFLVSERDAVSLADRIQELFDSPIQARQIGAAARRHVLENYDASKLNDELDRLYRELCA